MALAITYVPPDLSSFQDDLIYTVTDTAKVADPVTYPNFKFIGDVYIGGVLVARLKKIPHPTTGVGIFNIGQIVRSYAATAFNPSGSLLAQVLGEGEFFLSVVMKFGEEYSFTEFLDIEVDLQRRFFNNYNRILFGATSSLIAKSDDMATNRSFMNNTGHVLLTSPYYFIPFFPTIGAISVVITPILSNGTPGSPYSTTVTPSSAFALQQFNVSPVAINAASPGLINSTTAVYKVKIGTINTFFIAIICESQYQPYMVHFLNQYGGFDSKMFTKVSRKTYDITKSQFSKLPYTVDESGNVTFVNSNKVYNETDSTYSSQFTETLTLNSDNLNDADYIWLKDLLLSPMVYVEDNGYFFSAQIQENNYEARKNINDEMTNLTITLKFGKQMNAQFR